MVRKPARKAARSSSAAKAAAPATAGSEREKIIAAFQRHFRPAQVDGIADGATLQTLRKLLIARDSQPQKPAPRDPKQGAVKGTAPAP